ncbi:DUF4054 domain-containing protein [Uliginosibacterium sp. sgz301328]|uniref:DUF4054 domain-containing protein n=1 Tax=Uliginosibacterium sp. sgz301328 TaxID=3243764 RepID=UPI00359E130A
MDAAQFRLDFPEFADTSVYPDAQVNFWLSLGAKLLPPCRWGDLLDYGLELFTAHNLVIQTRNQQIADAGGTPGAVTGPATSKAVDKVSVSYDAASVLNADAGDWNMTTYGIQFYRLMMMVGAGGVQL